ncbi:hypothetical protein [Niallia sp. Krafla_26]|uniref:hypothetical protein n=1 Tax=Niallia sp. Krafla_26 TaxID=3064703 RepID=UPI003D176A63
MKGFELWMKKGTWLLIASLSIFLAACQSEQVENNFPANEPLVENNPPDSEQESVTIEEIPAKDQMKEPYQLKKSTYQNGGFLIHYPQLTQMEDKLKEQQINELLEKEILEYVAQYEDVDATLTMDYEVMLNTPYTLSIRYTGDYYFKGGMYPSYLLFTTNLDLPNGEKLRLDDFVQVNEEFIKKFKSVPYMDRENPPNEELTNAVKDYVESMNPSVLKQAFDQADLPNLNDNQHGIFTFIQDDALIISIQVPHVIGDHVEFKMELD